MKEAGYIRHFPYSSQLFSLKKPEIDSSVYFLPLDKEEGKGKILLYSLCTLSTDFYILRLLLLVLLHIFLKPFFSRDIVTKIVMSHFLHEGNKKAEKAGSCAFMETTFPPSSQYNEAAKKRYNIFFVYSGGKKLDRHFLAQAMYFWQPHKYWKT